MIPFEATPVMTVAEVVGVVVAEVLPLSPLPPQPEMAAKEMNTIKPNKLLIRITSPPFDFASQSIITAQTQFKGQLPVSIFLEFASRQGVLKYNGVV
jgi:hypothetical protein